MKSPWLMTAMIAGILSIGCWLMAGERAIATGETSRAIELIESGLDWDEFTPISTVKQAERMEANVSILRTQISSRNWWGLLGLATSTLAVSAAIGFRKRRSVESRDFDSASAASTFR